MISPEQLAEWEQAWKAATAGPNTVVACYPDSDDPAAEFFVGFGERQVNGFTADSTIMGYADAVYTASARTAMPALCAEVRHQSRYIEQLILDLANERMRADTLENDNEWLNAELERVRK